MIWLAKAVVQKFLSIGPYGFQINQWIKKIRKTELDPADPFNTYLRISILEDLIVHFSHNYKNKMVLEVGSGWSVELPALAYLMGFENFSMSDISCLMRNDSIKAKLSTLSSAIEKSHKYEIYGNYKIFNSIEFNSKLKILSKITNLKEFLELTNYKYIYPLDISKLSVTLSDNKVDALISFATLEHIPKLTLSRSFHEVCNVLNVHGISIHIIDHNDHFEYIDKSITRLNMHKYSNDIWNILTSDFNYTNRLLMEDYYSLINTDKLWIKIDPLFYLSPETMTKFIEENPSFKSKEKMLSISTSKLTLKIKTNVY